MSNAPHNFNAASVTGSTDVYLILGDPVEQVLAPEIFNPLFALLGINAVLVPVCVAPEHLSEFVKTAFLAKNVKGLWVTIPHKTPVMAVLSRCSELALRAGAVNAIRRHADGSLEGGLFDGEGLIASLDYFQMPYTAKKVLIIGAGGAAAAIGASLALGPRAAAEMAFYDPTPAKAQDLAHHLTHPGSAYVRAAHSSDPSGFDLVINASPLGLKPTDPLPCDVSRLDAHAALMDIVMKNQPTPVVRSARARGLNGQPGFEMMIQQAALYLEFFGFNEAAQLVRADATFLREKIYPMALHAEIQRPVQAANPFVSVPVPIY